MRSAERIGFTPPPSASPRSFVVEHAPLDPPFDISRDLLRAFTEQREYTSTVERQTNKIISWVFHHFGGKPIKHIDAARRKACLAANAIGKDGISTRPVAPLRDA